ncbi:MAG TPA: DUF748 domain-containing protein [Noviherbaspirillum sp.]|uniref:DUF748 domain-containing protein n=1 Tax=Noviherbaspirillum sp. TaxID=1926288 RepID=UPI002B49F26C|nr:DUF748 domain-containing protein [Noviherbaspirillum sp.]HJV84253.1 DUF748 domain-containing protein [Noviherbaspirillum sp.]
MPSLPSPRLPALLGKRPFRRTILVAGSALLLYTLLGFVVLPAVVKAKLENLASTQLHRKLSIGAVEANPFSLVMNIRDLKLMEPEGDVVFASFDALTINLSTESLVRLAPVVQQAQLTKPYVHLVRQQANRYNIDDILALISSQPPSQEPARFSVNNIQLEQGRVDFVDKPVKATHTVNDIKLGVPFVSSLPSDVQIFVEPLLSANVNGTPLLIQGKARPFAEPRDATIEFGLHDLDLTRYVEYLPFKPRFKVAGAKFDVQLSANFRQPKNTAPTVLVSGQASLKSLRINTLDGKPVIKLPELALTLRDTNVFSNRIDLARLTVTGLEADVERDGDGQLSIARLLPDTSAPVKPGAAAARATPSIALGEFDLRGAKLRFADAHALRPLQASTEKLDLALRKLSIDTGKRTVSVGEVASNSASFQLRQDKQTEQAARAATTSDRNGKSGDQPYAVNVGRVDIRNWTARLEDRSEQAPAVTMIAPVSLSVQDFSTASSTPAHVELKATVDKKGLLAANGNVVLAPFQADLAVSAKEVDLLPLQPYIADRLNLRLTRAALTSNGKLKLKLAANGDLNGDFKGDVTLGNLATVDKVSGNDFLRWKSLFVGGIDMNIAPFTLKADQVALSDFFARIIIDPTGRINLQDIVRDVGARHKSLTEVSAPAAQAATAVKSEAPPARQTPPITIRKLTLQGGRVRFTDNFIKPHYSATLAEFGGAVTGLSSDPETTAGLDLRGEVNNAPLSVAGRINPLKGDLFLDLKANVRGMELAPLSAYSGKYVGYGIEKGKLSFEVAYRVDKRVLSAENRLILDQLTFGDKVESPTATTLPVRFAVALLRDSRGVIDVNLPIGGSLDDPQFSVGGLVAKVIVNVITKAVTKPFALLGALFGGGEELSSLDLAPGSAAIPPAAQDKLNKLSKALADRPALQLEITAHVDPEADRAGLKRAYVERKVRAVKIRDLQAKGQSPAPGSVVISASEYPELLTRAYRDEKFPKPRNLVGLPKTLPVEEMEKLMIANVEINDDDLVSLGNRRAMAVKTWLEDQGQVNADRMFVLAPKVSAPDKKASNESGSRVDFSLR